MARVTRTFAIAIAALMLLVTLGVVLAYTWFPVWARDKLQEIGTQELGRSTTVERVEVRPFRLQAIVHGIRVAAVEPDRPPLLEVARVELAASLASLRHRAPVIDALRVTEPTLRVARVASNRYDVQDLIDRFTSAPPGPPPRFSINNVELAGGTIELDDRPQSRSHRVEALAIGIPFLSSLPYDATINVQPKLDAIVNGSRFALSGDTTPFAETRQAVLAIDLDKLPIASYVGYVPVKPRFVVASGALTTKLRLTFAQPRGTAPTLQLAGDVVVDDLAVRRRDGAPLASAARIAVALDRVDPGAASVAIAKVGVERPALAVRRLADGSLELAQPWIEASPPGTATPATEPWRIDVREAVVSDGTLRIEDVAVDPAYRSDWNGLSMRATGLSTERNAKARVEASFKVDDRATATLGADAVLRPFAFAGRFDLKGADLVRLYPYAASALAVEIRGGTIDAALAFDLRTEPSTTLRFTDGRAALRDTVVAAPGERDPLWRVPELAAEGVDVDVQTRTVRLGSTTIRKPSLLVRRDADGDWNFARVVRTTATTGATGAGESGASPELTWQVIFVKAGVEKGDIRFEDRTVAPAVALRFSDFNAATENLGNARGRRGTLSVATRVGERGRLTLRGPMSSNPFGAEFDIRASNVALVPLRSYVETNTRVALLDGTVSAHGRATVAPASAAARRDAISWSGDVRIENLEVVDREASAELVRWRSLSLDKLVVRDDPLAVTVDRVALDDFKARLIVTPDGSLNLARLLSQPDAAAEAPAPAKATAAAATVNRPFSRGRSSAATAAAPAGPAAAPTATGKVAQAAESAHRTIRRVADGALPFAIGRIEMSGGNVNFTDLYIRPNYSANLTGVAGTISAMSPTQPGEVALTAKVDDAAPVDVRGTIQPFARELSLDIRGSARDIELPPLSPYSGKYAGYGITKGKMSFDVAYKVEDRRLDAKNRLVLDQLTFGEKVESPDATKLPVLLAVALLKDRNGRIDIELPVQGTLDDPQFSVFGIIVRIIVNLIAKAATAPFALLASMHGGGEELAYLDFAPGSADLGGDAQAKIDKLSKALGDRPNLKVDIAGHVNAATDKAALEQEALARMIRNAQRKANREEAAEGAVAKPMSAEERQRWLTAAYRDAPIKDKPRNAIGMLKEVPPAEMEAALVASAGVDDKALADLGLRRAQHAKEALAKQGVAVERLFLVTPKAASTMARVDFALR